MPKRQQSDADYSRMTGLVDIESMGGPCDPNMAPVLHRRAIQRRGNVVGKSENVKIDIDDAPARIAWALMCGYADRAD